MNYRKITEDIFIPETSSPEPIKLSELIAERDRLMAQMEAKEPSEAELLEWAQGCHPYYINYDSSLESLTALIINLESL